ncbi:hypothetical protein R50345_00215 [Paenibacillus sp. FSL R5-0345]|nr:hypothetical protein R50345_00215 [Paenibacillus sp. FSL R5-0345]
MLDPFFMFRAYILGHPQSTWARIEAPTLGDLLREIAAIFKELQGYVFLLSSNRITDNKDISSPLIARKKIPLTTKYSSSIIIYLL